ncbi:hypothetical protein C5167_032838 [Papaver somniferum]|uniref:N-acetyltransferase domain-containing protein n=1 Tax=Papaver somniferum TaxID=3469 RepID=A0A4Y7KCP1_PAPSO|nr:uncharacterized protein LOC113297791 [Papaver somniferum]RZC69705.1 hypothetical protein C5167_032838 [Papaver somniferum]
MAILTSSSCSSIFLPNLISRQNHCNSGIIFPNLRNPRISKSNVHLFSKTKFQSLICSQLCTSDKTLTLDTSALDISVAVAEDEIWASACLRVRSFYDFKQSFGIEDHKKHLAELEFEASKERIAGTREGFKRVCCVNVTLPLSRMSSSSDELCSACKYSANGEDRVVIGTLDINQCVRLPDEITGKRPQGSGADVSRAYLSNVCVAKELQRNGLGYLLVSKSKKVAQEWGITDLYVHVAFENEPARRLYGKSGFVYESDEPAWQARYLDRPRRILLWSYLARTHNS